MSVSTQCIALMREFYVNENNNLIKQLEEVAINGINSKLINIEEKGNLIKVLLNTAYQIGKTK